MKRSDKFRQANREALATVIATIAVVLTVYMMVSDSKKKSA